MKIYLASRYSRHEEMLGHARTLEAAGHQVTSRWIYGNHDIVDSDRHADIERNERVAIEDIQDLTKADCVISFTEVEKASKIKKPSKGGRHVEFGVGLAHNKLMVVVGPRENVFHWLPSVDVYDTLEDFLSTVIETEE